MAKRNFKTAAKKSIAVLSTVALLLSCGTTGLFSAGAEETNPKNTHPGHATKMYIYDEEGYDITDSPIIYLDNSSAAGQATSTRVTVTIENDEDVLNDSILWTEPQVSADDRNFKTYGVSYTEVDNNKQTATIEIRACENVVVNSTDPITNEPIKEIDEQSYKPGTSQIHFLSETGEVYRTLDVVVLEPATDMIVYWGNRNIALPLNDDTTGNTSEDSNIMNNTTSMTAIANHKYPLFADLVSSSSTDEVEWAVYDGSFNMKKILNEGFEPSTTDKAEISPDGIFTPKKNGVVTIVANFKATERAKRNAERTGVFVSDRQYTIGSKTRFVKDPVVNVYLNKYTIDYNELTGRISYNRDPKTITSSKRAIVENGNYVLSHTSELAVDENGIPYKAIRKDDPDHPGRYIYEENAEEGTNQYIDVYRPVYEDLKTVPKYIHVYIIKENPAKTMSFKKTTSAMEIGETFPLELEVEPSYKGDGYESGATDVFTWTSSNPEIASVDQDGVVTAHRKGDVKITAKGENDNVFTECNITVLTKANSVVVTPKPTSTRVDVPITLTATMAPVDANEEIIWESEDPSIATVESTTVGQFTNVQTAVVTGKSVGKTFIVAKAKNSGYSERCQVTVNDKIPSDNLVLSTTDGVTITAIPDNTKDDPLKVYTGQDVNVNALLQSDDGSTPDDKVVWTIEGNESDFVTIPYQDSKSIKLHGVSEGTIKITAASEANPDLVNKTIYVQVLKSCDYVNIIRPDTNESLLGSTKALNIGDQLQLNAILTIDGNYPYNHSDSVKSWVSEYPEIASIDNNGLVTAHKNGYSNITVTTASGRKASLTINAFTTSDISINNIKASTDGVSLPTATLELNDDFEGSLRLTSNIKDQENEYVWSADSTWSSENEDVATISSNGEITGVGVGKTIITVKSGNKMEKCELTVKAPISAAKIDDIPPFIYSPHAEAYEPKPIVKINDQELVEGVDYNVEYSNNTQVGFASLKITGAGYYFYDKDIVYEINQKQISQSDIIISNIEPQECTGTEVKPEISIMYEGVQLVENVDYTLYYSSNYIPGTGSVLVTGIGNYTGTTEKQFELYCNHNKELYNIEIIKEATKTETGLEEGQCSICGETVQRAIPVKVFIGMCGDMDNDGELSAADSLTILRYTVDLENLTDDQLYLADVNNDGFVDSADSLSVLRYSVGLIDNDIIGNDK